MEFKVMTYLILHSQHGGALDKPWQVIRCSWSNDEQEVLFEASRELAYDFLRIHWDDV
jgi:hypothetical protein